MNYNLLYKEIFSKLEKQFGALDPDTLSSIVGFSAGGPVNLSKMEKKKIYTTCELATYDTQIKSIENLKFELLSIGDFDIMWCRNVFTQIGELALNTALGDGHTINISELVEEDDPIHAVRLELYSQYVFKDVNYGLYRVRPYQ